ncbi:hypothetical protein LCL61_24080 [Amycolatopsis coloradensis]|uniref:Uncharacterized protein n=1 Tax=Amycolatopsis coloradensis TaxID=76021 RepID=A0ACD5BGV1_9PSEU
MAVRGGAGEGAAGQQGFVVGMGGKATMVVTLRACQWSSERSAVNS